MEILPYKKGMLRSVQFKGQGKEFYNIDDCIKMYGNDTLWEIFYACVKFDSKYIDFVVDHIWIDEDHEEVLFATNERVAQKVKVCHILHIPKDYSIAN